MGRSALSLCSIRQKHLWASGGCGVEQKNIEVGRGMFFSMGLAAVGKNGRIVAWKFLALQVDA